VEDWSGIPPQVEEEDLSFGLQHAEHLAQSLRRIPPVMERESRHDEIHGIARQRERTDVALSEGYAAFQALAGKITVSCLNHALRDIDSHQLKVGESAANQSEQVARSASDVQ